MQKAYDVVTVGDALIDLFLSIHDANIHCHLNEKECELCFKYGDKIPLDKYALRLGGTASNIAVGLSRCGFSVGIMAETGSDEFADTIINGLNKEKVDLTFLEKTNGARSSIGISIQFKNERTLFVEHVERDHDFRFENLQTKWIYLAGLGNKWKGVYQKTADYVKKGKCKLVFVPGSLQLDQKGEELFEMLKLTDILFVNKEEAEVIVSSVKRLAFSLDNKMKELLRAVQELGPKIVVITDGKNGSYVLDEKGKFYQYGIIPAKVVQKTGAGDGYASGFFAAIIEGKTIKEAMKWGTINSASVISDLGAQPGLLTKEEIKDRIKKL